MSALDGIPLTTGEFEWIAPRPLTITDKRRRQNLVVSFNVRGHCEHWPKKLHERIEFAQFHAEENSVIWQEMSFRRVYHTGAFIGSPNPYSLYYVCCQIEKAILSWEQEVAYAVLNVRHFATNMPDDILGKASVTFPFLGMVKDEASAKPTEDKDD